MVFIYTTITTEENLKGKLRKVIVLTGLEEALSKIRGEYDHRTT